MSSSPSPEQNRLLAALGPADRDALMALGQLVDTDVGHDVFRQGERIETVDFPLSGVVSLVVALREGASIEVAAVGRDGLVGIRTDGPDAPAATTATYQVPGTALRMPVSDLVACLDRSPQLRRLVDGYLQVLFAQAAQGVACNRFHSLDQRFARWLLQFHDRVDGDRFHLTQEFMAEMLGVRRATVTIAAGTLQRAGAIAYHRGDIEVVGRDALEAAACECYAALRTQTEALIPD